MPDEVAATPDQPEVEIEKLVYGGSGLARRDGQVLLAPFVLPGERVKLEPSLKKGVAARVVERLSDSPERIKAPCPYFGVCGGCQYQHAKYPAQLQAKVAILREQFSRVGKFDFPGEIQIVSGPEYHYRNRSQFQMSEGRIGYFEEGSHDLVPVRECIISSPVINNALDKLRGMVPDFVRRFELFTNETEVQFNVLDTGRPLAKRFFEACAERINGILSPALDYKAGDDLFRVSHSSFFQVNRFLIGKMIEASLSGVAAEGKGGDTAFDLYCGVGLFTLPLARRFRKVVGVELGTSASRDLEFNLERAKISNVRAVKNQAEQWLAAVTEAPDFVLADPPRAGLGKLAVSELNRIKPRELVIVSCDPATLARDLAGLRAGGFELISATLIDLFPQTYHLETIVRLRHSS
jgi:23S rRNA (uracil1939-C5)-methyltransferase